MISTPGKKNTPRPTLGENVIDLTKKMHGTGASVFADTYFSSPKLAALLLDCGINFVSVFRKDRKDMPPYKDVKKNGRRRI